MVAEYCAIELAARLWIARCDEELGNVRDAVGMLAPLVPPDQLGREVMAEEDATIGEKLRSEPDDPERRVV